MSLPEISIKKPVTVFMVTMIVIIFGLVSLTKLPVELQPNTSFGEISIIIQVRGGILPTEVETLVTRPIEEAVATVSNLKQLLSISKEGESTVVLSFTPGTDMNFSAIEVREKFAKVKNRLPKEIEKPVIAQFQQKAIERMQDALGLAGHGTPSTLTRQEAFERIRQEVTLYGIRIDVSEELSRLTAHLTETRHILKKGGQVGKRLDFMMQELNREANTLGAKASVKELADASMELKLLIEQMREQVQNLE